MSGTPTVLATRYRFEHALGSGNQGTTWLATRLEDEQPVAVKTLRLSAVSDWKAVELFEREATVLKGLDIEGVPRLYEYVADESDPGEPRFHLVMEYVEGQSALDMMRNGYRFAEDEVINMAWQILGILERLHGVSPPIVHRDIKPSNIIVRPGGNCALVDFGAVTGQQRSEDDEGGTVAGTFGYMAPEQFQGRAVPASDIYGVGATMVHLLSGKAPSSMDTELFRLDFRPHVQASEPLLDLIDRMLAPEVPHRVQSATDARTALQYVELGGAPDDDEADEEGALVPAGSVDDLVAAGQPGSLAIFHALPATPRKVPWSYTRKLFARTALYVGGGGAAAALVLAGAGTLLGLGIVEVVMLIALPFVLTWGLLSRGRKLKKLIRHGERATGSVRAIRGASNGYRVSYEFEVRGKPIRGDTLISGADVLWEPGDEVGILYMTDDPETNVVYPIPAAAAPNALVKEE